MSNETTQRQARSSPTRKGQRANLPSTPPVSADPKNGGLLAKDRAVAKNGDLAKKNGNGAKNGGAAKKSASASEAANRGERDEAGRDEAAFSRETMMRNAVGGSVPVTEWDLLSAPSRAEVESLVEVLKAVKQGDFSVRFDYEKRGVLSRVGEILNDIIGFNEHLSGELLRVGKVVGQEGKMHERASVGATRGAWATGLSSVNQLIADLVAPTNEVARVITAVARGDLSQKMILEIEGRPVRGEFLRIGTTVNSMVDQLNSFAAEVTRVAKEVGNEGKLGGQADVKGVSGTWKDLTDNVNGLAANLTAQVRNIAKVTTAVAKGDLSQKITVDAKGEILELKNTINVMVDQLSSFAAEVTRVAKEVGNEGKLGGQAEVKGVSGTWKDLTDNVNGLAANLTAQVRSIAKVTTAVANGDLSQKITVDARGEIYELKNTINTMVDTLRSFAAEVARVAKEVGTEGKLGGQADVKGVSGTWKDLTDNVNAMASNLTVQLRDVSKVATAIANGDLDPEDHRRREGGDPPDQGRHQQDGRPAQLVRGGGHPRREGGRHRGEARRAGGRQRGLRDVEGPHRQRERSRREPDRPGAKHRQGDDGGREGGPVAEDHRRREGGDLRAEEHDQRHGRSALVVRRRGHPRREGSR